MNKSRSISRNGAVIFAGFIMTCLVLFLLAFVMELWRADLAVPFVYGGDSLLFHQMTKSMIDNGWFLNNAFMGAPQGLNLNDFPQPDILHLVVVKLISLATGDYAVAMNLFYILTYPLTALLAWYSLMRLGVSPFASFAGAVLYAFIPYHYLKGESHIYLAAYYMLPLAAVIVMRVYSGELNIFGGIGSLSRREKRAGLIWGLVVAALVSCTGIYYSYFTCFFLLVAGAGRSFAEKRLSPLATSLLLSAVIAGGLFVCLAPSWLHVARNGYNPHATHRVFHDTDLYSLKMAKLVLPVQGHRVNILSAIRDQYNREASYIYRAQESESDCATLGVMGSAGFMISLAALLLFLGGRSNDNNHCERLRQLGALNVAAILLAIAAGFSTFVAPFTQYRIRSYSRISIFMAFFSLFALMLVADRLYDSYLKDRWVVMTAPGGKKKFRANLGTALAVICLGAAVCAGVFDQSGSRAVPAYDSIRKEYSNDARFIADAERALPTGTKVFMLPYLQFPEEPAPPHLLKNFEYFKYYLHSKSLRWSYGAVNGRPPAAWQRRVSQMPPGEFVREVKGAGFGAVLVSRRGYKDGGAGLVHRLGTFATAPPVVSPDGSAILFPL